MEKELLSMKEAAALLSISLRKLYLMSESNEMKTVRVGTRRLIRLADLREYVAALPTQGE